MMRATADAAFHVDTCRQRLCHADTPPRMLIFYAAMPLLSAILPALFL